MGITGAQGRIVPRRVRDSRIGIHRFSVRQPGSHAAGSIASWPGLSTPNLDDGELAITVDHRDILAEIPEDRMACTSLGTVLPSYTIGSYQDVTD